MLIKIIALFIAGVILTGCTATMTPFGKVDVYHFKNRLPENCTKLGEIQVTAGSLMGKREAMASAEAKLAEKAAKEYKADAVLILELSNHFVSTNNEAFAKGIAYKCE
jgi:hypothetical protein